MQLVEAQTFAERENGGHQQLSESNAREPAPSRHHR